MSTKDQNPQELSSLIDQAAQVIEKQAEHQRRLTSRKPNSSARNAALILLLIGIGLIVSLLFSSHLPPSRQQISTDLDLIIKQAQDSVEAGRGLDGSLPATIPNASLASVVEYEHDLNEYQLSATIMGVKVTMERSGRKTTNLGD